MKNFSRFSEKLAGLTIAVRRYPVATGFLLLAAAVNAYALRADKVLGKALMACIVGAAISAVFQAAYERFGGKFFARLSLALTSIALAGGYYLLICSGPDYSTETSVRTAVIVFALLFAYMLIPAAKGQVGFNESFMAAFKALFQALFYTAVLFIGCSLIIAAFDTLISPVGSDTYLHTANLVFVLIAPVFFLSLIPVYPGRHNLRDITGSTAIAQEEAITRATYCPKFLEILISFIIIPLAEIFTVILALYIFLNIGGDFWHNNLLEPLLISYAVAIILILFLSGRLENRMAVWFCKIFPKVLVPIVAFQLVASALILRDTGVTHPRYFVILFGIFAACAGVLLSLNPVKYSGVASALLIAFSIASITPPTDAFTVSKSSQLHRLETTLIQNSMLQNETLLPSANISESDKEKIASSLDYLYRMNAIRNIAWLPESFDYYADFESAFGFSRYSIYSKSDRYFNVQFPPGQPIDISGYNILAWTSVDTDVTAKQDVGIFEKGNKNYTLVKTLRNGQPCLMLIGPGDEEIIIFNMDEIYSRYSEFGENPPILSLAQATFSTENDRAKLSLIVQNVNMNTSSHYYYADFYVLIAFK